MLAFLQRHGLAKPGEVAGGEELSGGVSSDIWRIDLASGPLVVKRALPRLRVAQVWEAPVERNRYERLWLETANAILPGAAPKVLAGDDGGCFAMEYLPGLPVWKEELRAGRAEPAFAADVGRRLATIHSATARRADIAATFATHANFHALRLEPYLLAAARVNGAVASRLKNLSDTTAKSNLALVHGDVSPKNILVGRQGAIFLDAECAWYGDPAFDLAFCLNHLLLKCLWVPRAEDMFLRCFDSLANSYGESVDWEDRSVLEQRAAALLPGLLLARVDGKSPVEYLQTEAQKEAVRGFARRLLLSPPGNLAELRQAWQRS